MNQMRGTIVKYEPKAGRPSFGFYFVAGRDENGKRIQIKKRGFAKKTDAEKALKKAIEEYEKKPARERVNLTFAEFFERWHSQKQRHCAPKTGERYYQLGQYAVRTFGDILLTELDTMGFGQLYGSTLRPWRSAVKETSQRQTTGAKDGAAHRIPRAGLFGTGCRLRSNRQEPHAESEKTESPAPPPSDRIQRWLHQSVPQDSRPTHLSDRTRVRFHRNEGRRGPGFGVDGP
jgi:hypothetical protein